DRALRARGAERALRASPGEDAADGAIALVRDVARLVRRAPALRREPANVAGRDLPAGAGIGSAAIGLAARATRAAAALGCPARAARAAAALGCPAAAAARLLLAAARFLWRRYREVLLLGFGWLRRLRRLELGRGGGSGSLGASADRGERSEHED